MLFNHLNDKKYKRLKEEIKKLMATVVAELIYHRNLIIGR